jgi:DNA polymerase III delta prime subunit
MMNNDQFLWVEKYRPKTIADTILPEGLKKTFQQFVDQKNVPNLLLTGSAGVGKTTVARAMLEELEADYIVINGSMNGNIDTLRTTIQNFASSVSFSGGRKYVILDEADYLNANSTQPALRNFMEEYSKNCGFILTCNFKNRIIEPLHSRCTVVEFKIPSNEKPKIAAKFYRRVVDVLTAEKVEFDAKVVAGVVEKHFPDFRRTLNELQRYAVSGKIDTGILVDLQESNIKELVSFLKQKDFTSVRKWVAENTDADPISLFRKLYDSSNDLMKPSSIPQMVLILADYQYKQAFVADQEVNTVACLTELMVECEFK